MAHKIELEEELSRLPQERFSDDQVQDPGDQALSSTMESLRSSIQDAKLGEYNRLVKALSMIEQGTYGVCADCSNPISDKRLKMYPDATRCIACQEAFEEDRSISE
jgi:DnaK suppressor protein